MPEKYKNVCFVYHLWCSYHQIETNICVIFKSLIILEYKLMECLGKCIYQEKLTEELIDLLPCFLTWVIDKFKIRQMYHILVTNKTRSNCIIGSNTVNGQQDVLPKWISLRKNTRWWMIRKCTRESRLISKFSHKF